MSLASRRKCDNADGSLKSRFLYADARMPVTMEADGQTYYLVCDQVGSLRAVADASGTVVKTVTYDAFGNVLEDSNESLTVPFGFAGGLYEADAGLVRFGFRDYDAEVGRWTAKDPIGFGGGDSDLYGYCGGKPVNWVDIDGKFPRNFFLPDHWSINKERRIFESAIEGLPNQIITETVYLYNNCLQCVIKCTIEVALPSAATEAVLRQTLRSGAKTVAFAALKRAVPVYTYADILVTARQMAHCVVDCKEK